MHVFAWCEPPARPDHSAGSPRRNPSQQQRRDRGACCHVFANRCVYIKPVLRDIISIDRARLAASMPRIMSAMPGRPSPTANKRGLRAARAGARRRGPDDPLGTDPRTAADLASASRNAAVDWAHGPVAGPSTAQIAQIMLMAGLAGRPPIVLSPGVQLTTRAKERMLPRDRHVPDLGCRRRAFHFNGPPGLK